MKVLELFSGTHSVKKICDKYNWNTISLDLNTYKNIEPPTHQEDILTWNYKQYDVNEFDIIWASPPCVYYSALQNTWIGRKKKRKDGSYYVYTKELHKTDMLLADEWVKKTLEIIYYFKPSYWFIENPYSSRLKKRGVMDHLNYYDVDYCKYSDWGYKKKTRIWTNKIGFIPKVCKKDCDNMINIDNSIYHQDNCGNSKIRKKIREFHKKHKKDCSKNVGGGNNRLDRYRIPPLLIEDLFKGCKEKNIKQSKLVVFE